MKALNVTRTCSIRVLYLYQVSFVACFVIEAADIEWNNLVFLRNFVSAKNSTPFSPHYSSFFFIYDLFIILNNQVYYNMPFRSMTCFNTLYCLIQS